MFNPPLPNDVAVSFYIHTSKLVLALYCLHQNNQHKVEITHRVQVSPAKVTTETLAFQITCSLFSLNSLLFSNVKTETLAFQTALLLSPTLSDYLVL